jgi:hypothetical protein
MRNLTLAALALALVLTAVPAQAGSYLDRAVLLLSQATHEADYLRTRLSDHELARVCHEMADARLKAASTMDVPKEVAAAHPHLLLVLTDYERATEFAKEHNAQRFFVYLQKAREEDRILHGVFKELGWPLPPDR